MTVRCADYLGGLTTSFCTLNARPYIQIQLVINTNDIQLLLSVCLSPFYWYYFPAEPGLASTRTSPLWILLELRMMEVVVTTEAVRRAKLQSNRYHQQTNTQFFFRMPFLLPNQQCQSIEGNTDDIHVS